MFEKGVQLDKPNTLLQWKVTPRQVGWALKKLRRKFIIGQRDTFDPCLVRVSLFGLPALLDVDFQNGLASAFTFRFDADQQLEEFASSERVNEEFARVQREISTHFGEPEVCYDFPEQMQQFWQAGSIGINHMLDREVRLHLLRFDKGN